MKKKGLLLLLSFLLLSAVPAVSKGEAAHFFKKGGAGRIQKIDSPDRWIYIRGERLFVAYGARVIGPMGKRQNFAFLRAGERVFFETAPAEEEKGVLTIKRLRVMNE